MKRKSKVPFSQGWFRGKRTSQGAYLLARGGSRVNIPTSLVPLARGGSGGNGVPQYLYSGAVQGEMEFHSTFSQGWFRGKLSSTVPLAIGGSGGN